MRLVQFFPLHSLPSQLPFERHELRGDCAVPAVEAQRLLHVRDRTDRIACMVESKGPAVIEPEVVQLLVHRPVAWRLTIFVTAVAVIPAIPEAVMMFAFESSIYPWENVLVRA